MRSIDIDKISMSRATPMEDTLENNNGFQKNIGREVSQTELKIKINQNCCK